MANWAEIDENNIVLRVVVGDDNFPDEGLSWLIENLGGRWIKTSYNTINGEHINGGTPIRGTYAGEGYFYDEILDIFIPPQPYPSWILDTNTCIWNPPIEIPSEGNWQWNEETQSWIPRVALVENIEN